MQKGPTTIIKYLAHGYLDSLGLILEGSKIVGAIQSLEAFDLSMNTHQCQTHDPRELAFPSYLDASHTHNQIRVPRFKKLLPSSHLPQPRSLSRSSENIILHSLKGTRPAILVRGFDIWWMGRRVAVTFVAAASTCCMENARELQAEGRVLEASIYQRWEIFRNLREGAGCSSASEMGRNIEGYSSCGLQRERHLSGLYIQQEYPSFVQHRGICRESRFLSDVS